MTARTYVVLIEDLDLALTVGHALEDRLARDGHRAVALVPTPSGQLSTLTGQVVGTGPGQAGHRPGRGRPHVVTVYQDGMLDWLESLGLAAYVGIPDGEKRRVIDWGNGTGAMLLPVASARDLVDAVGRYAPWPSYVGAPSAAAVHADGVARPGARSSLYRKLAVAGVTGPMVLAGLPLATAAAATTSQLAARPSAQAPVSAVDTAYQVSQGSPAGAGSNAGAPAAAPSWWSRAGTAIQNYMAQQGQMEIDNAQANLAMGQQINSGIASLWPSWPTPAVGGENGFAYGTLAGVVVGGIIGGGLGALAGPEAIIPGMIAGGYKGGEYGLIFGTALGTAIGMTNQYMNQQSAPGPGQPGTESQAPGNSTTTGSNTNAQDNATAQQASTGTQDGTQATGTDGTTRGLTTGNGTTSQGGQTSNGTAASSGNGNTSSGAGNTSSGAGNTSSGAGNTSSGAGNTSSGNTSSAAGNTSSGAGNTSSGAGNTSSGAGNTSSGAGNQSSGGGNTSAANSTS